MDFVMLTTELQGEEADFSLRTAAVGEEATGTMTTFQPSDAPGYGCQQQPLKKQQLGGNAFQAIPSDDGYNWRKYGQKEMKVGGVSGNRRSYYRCTFPGCPVKKKLERSLPDGQIMMIAYTGAHNHARPYVCARNSITAAQLLQLGGGGEASDHTFGGMSGVTVATLENPSASVGNDDVVRVTRSPRSTGCSRLDEHEKDPKRLRKDTDGEGISTACSRTVPEPRVVVQTRSDVDIIDDGFRWRKYGQKELLGSPNPRSYYKCAMAGCPMRKHMERASHDLRVVVTTYTGEHNHDAPARGPSSLDRPPPAVANQSSGGAGQQQYAHGFSSLGSVVGVSRASAQGDGGSFEVITP